MSYATGSAANLNELLAALQTFAAARGWTVVKWTSASNLLFMSKSSCFVAMQGSTASVTHYPGGVSTTYTDTVLRVALSTSLTSSLTTYNSHPGSIVTSAADADRIEVNDLVGPFSTYHFFSGDESGGDPPYIHVVVQTATDRWQHFSFGMVDKRGLSHSGVAYLMGMNRVYYRNNASLTTTTQRYNDPAQQATPFDGGRGSLAQSVALYQFYLPDVLPVSWAAPAIVSNYQDATAALPTLTQNITPAMRPTNYGGSDFPRLLSSVIASPVSQWAGNVTLFPCPVFISNASQLCHVGDFPNVRIVNMDSLGPGSEITYGTDTWKVFPSLSQRAWGQDRLAGFDGPSTGQYAVAYKKVA